MSWVFNRSEIHGVGFFINFALQYGVNVVKNNKVHFFYVLYADKTWVFDQSEFVTGPIYIVIIMIIIIRNKVIGL